MTKREPSHTSKPSIGPLRFAESLAGSRLRAYTAGGMPISGAAMIQDVLGALWFIALIIVAYELFTGDLCLWRRDN